jgi:hypothetical protein
VDKVSEGREGKTGGWPAAGGSEGDGRRGDGTTGPADRLERRTEALIALVLGAVPEPWSRHGVRAMVVGRQAVGGTPNAGAERQVIRS